MDISKQTNTIDFDTKIIFVKPKDNLDLTNDLSNELNPKKELNTYYQICQFKNQFTKKYKTRKIIFNEVGEILKIFEREYKFDELDNFIKHHRQNKFKMYPTNDIGSIELPTTTDIICCKSELLNNNNQNYDYDKF